MKNKELFKDLCLRFAQESHCLSRHVACLAIKEDRIIATGINGTPKGSQNCDDYFLDYFLNHNNSTNQNEFFEAWTTWKQSDEFKSLHHAWSNNHELHAETNCIAFAAEQGISLQGAEFLVSLSPCIHCSKILIALNPKAVYYIEPYDKGFQESLELFKIANIPLLQI